VHRAWVALDRAEGGGRRAFDLLLWDYEAPQEEGGGGGGGPGDHYNCRSVLAFTGFEGPVLTCALVAPRGDRFEQQTLRYVLVVATQLPKRRRRASTSSLPTLVTRRSRSSRRCAP
jgi:hypothetical protein